jgi:peroxiredoxin
VAATIQCKAIRDSSEEIKSYDVAYFMASVDTVEKNTEFATEYELDFPVLADPDKVMTDAFGVLGARGFANRWTYYIDADGIVVQIDKENQSQHCRSGSGQQHGATGLQASSAICWIINQHFTMAES